MFMRYFGGGVGHRRHTSDGQARPPVMTSAVPPALDESDAKLNARGKRIAKWTTRRGKKLDEDEEVDFGYDENSDWEHGDEGDEAHDGLEDVVE